jgi:hypothetical protein
LSEHTWKHYFWGMQTPSRLFRTMRSSLILLVASSCLRVLAQSMGNPLDGLETLKDYETRRVSSSDPDWKNGNGDSRYIAPGGTLTLAELEGPGKIVHIWCTIAHEDPYYSRMLTLRIYWDGETHPSVECPVGDFFGVGHGIDKAFTALPIRVSSDGRGRNCYWPMPFRKSARLTVTNESKKPCQAVYYYVDWQKHNRIPESSAYFHAMYRQEYPCVMGRNYLLADIEGRGHYVGTVQSVQMSSAGWYGEGDDFFFIDGEKEPSLRGTGTEDYFCDGWGFRDQWGPFYGTPLWEGEKTGDQGTAYRFHIPDPVTFKKSLRVEIEHKGSQTFPDGKTDGFIERDDLMSSVAFWFQEEPHKPWPALPAGAERVPFHERVLVKGYEAVPYAKHSASPLEEQPVGGVTDGKQLWFRPGDEKGWVEIPFNVPAGGEAGDLVAKMVLSWDYGIYAVKVDGHQVASWDLFNPNVTPAAHKLTGQKLAAGEHTLRFECVGKTAESKGYLMGFDALVMRTAVYSRDASVDLRTLQKRKP